MPTPPTLTIHITNTTPTPKYAYITGLTLPNPRFCLIQSDGRTPYLPPSPPKILQPLTTPCAIPLGPPGTSTPVTIPRLAGGRIWISSHRELTFLLNPGGPNGGAALVEPSVLNPTDPNADVDFSFCEFTYNEHQLFANISYVDFVGRIPISLTLQTAAGHVQHVSGMPEDGLDRVASLLREQSAKDKMPWDKLIVHGKDGGVLRILSPTHGNAVGAKFDGYFEPLVEKAWARYREEGRHGIHLFHRTPAGAKLKINTQAGMGVVSGCVENNGELVIGGEKFCKPTTADIFGCNSGPFATGPNPTRNAIIPRLAAAFQRSCIVDCEEHPSHPGTFYRCEPTNHYSRVVHQCNLDGKGYAFAYDDVQPDGGEDQSGKVNAGDPRVFIVAVGGGGAYVGDCMP
ncbi:hypothetical protein OQA88_10781 [Cercophora sp. LCS_1]